MSNLTDNELATINSIKSEEEWNKMCDDVKAVRDGQYPDDWYAKVIMSGLMGRMVAKFGGSDEIRVTTRQL